MIKAGEPSLVLVKPARMGSSVYDLCQIAWSIECSIHALNQLAAKAFLSVTARRYHVLPPHRSERVIRRAGEPSMHWQTWIVSMSPWGIEAISTIPQVALNWRTHSPGWSQRCWPVWSLDRPDVTCSWGVLHPLCSYRSMSSWWPVFQTVGLLQVELWYRYPACVPMLVLLVEQLWLCQHLRQHQSVHQALALRWCRAVGQLLPKLLLFIDHRSSIRYWAMWKLVKFSIAFQLAPNGFENCVNEFWWYFWAARARPSTKCTWRCQTLPSLFEQHPCRVCAKLESSWARSFLSSLALHLGHQWPSFPNGTLVQWPRRPVHLPSIFSQTWSSQLPSMWVASWNQTRQWFFSPYLGDFQVTVPCTGDFPGPRHVRLLTGVSFGFLLDDFSDSTRETQIHGGGWDVPGSFTACSFWLGNVF